MEALKEVRSGYRPLCTIQCEKSFPVGRIALSPQGSLAAAGHLELNEIRAWKTATGSLLWSRGNRDPVKKREDDFSPYYVTGIDFTGDGKILVAAFHDGSLAVLDAQTGAPLKVMRDRNPGHLDLAVSNDGRMAATRSMSCPASTGCLAIWDLEQGTLTHTLPDRSDARGNLALAVTGNPLFSSSFNVVRAWDTRSGSLLREFPGSMVAISSAGTMALTYQEGSFRLWNVPDQKCLWTVRKPLAQRALVATHCLRFIFDLHGSDAMIIDMETLQCLRSLEIPGIAGKLTLAPRSYHALVSCENSLTLWHYPRDLHFPKAPYQVVLPGRSEEALSAEKELNCLLASVKTALAGDDIPAAMETYERVKALEGCSRLPEVLEQWPELSRRCRRSAFIDCWEEGRVTAPLHLLHRAGLSPDGSQAVFSGFLETAIWDLTVMKEVVKRKDPVVSLEMVPGGEQVLAVRGMYDPYTGAIETAGEEPVLYLWDTISGTARMSLASLGTAGPIRPDLVRIAVTPDGGSMVLGHNDRLAMYDLSRGTRAASIECALPDHLSLSPCGRLALATTKQEGFTYAYFIDVAHDAPVHTIAGLWKVLAYSADGLISAAHDDRGGTHLWSTRSGRILHSLEDSHGGITGMDFTSDGRFAVSVSLDGCLQVWDTATGQCLKSIGGGQSHDWKTGAPGIALSTRGDRALVWEKRGFRIFYLDWTLEARGSSPWNEDARAFLELFLAQHGFAGQDTPPFIKLIKTLELSGFGGIPHGAVRDELAAMSSRGSIMPLMESTGSEMACW
jgi:WD40 repeat protein